MYKYGNIRASGVNDIYPDGKNKVSAYCDMDDMNNRGYTRLMAKFARLTGEFNKSWAEYKIGFGELSRNHWIGLETIHQLTNRKKMNLFVEILDANNKYYNKNYSRLR